MGAQRVHSDGDDAVMRDLRQQVRTTPPLQAGEQGRLIARIALGDRASQERLVAAATDYERTELLLARVLRRAPMEAEIAEKLEWTVERTRYVAQVVAEARRRHDEELLAFIDPEALDPEAFDDAVDG